ncbi:MAG TPA: primosomal protein N' [Candidatus Binataceae bacterium]|jgi:primosomal protein N' (replication factor Y)|nr:primosomal protein N' [Candidatus Binataceae bacterium]
MAVAMQAKVILIGAARGVGQLTYAIPPALEGRVECGHRVLVPLRSRRMTGIVTEVGDGLEAGAGALKPILELPESRPLYDRAHLGLIEFMASYYMVPLGDAMQSVVPAAARIESRKVYRLAAPPDALRAATLAPMERVIVEALGRRAMTARELARLGERREIASALARLAAERIVQAGETTRGRHRTASAVRLVSGTAAATKLRSVKQREVVRLLAEAAPEALALEELDKRIPGARAAVRALAERGIVEVESASRAGKPPYSGDGTGGQHPYGAPGAIGGVGDFELMPEQAAAIETIMPAVTDTHEGTFLLWGVTASGKTEVYLKLAAAALEAGRQALLLVPEIALADQIVRSFRVRFGSLVAVAHSAQNVAERWASWMAALGGQARIIIGPRSAIFAPLNGLGLIVVDEEHDPAYKQEEGIRYNARDLAVVLGRLAQCPVVLGSATPSSESFYNARRGRYRLLRMARRVMERPMAEVDIIDLRQEFARAQKSEAAAGVTKKSNDQQAVPLSASLVDALRANLAAGGQSVVFLNRRGFHNFLQCHLCGVVISCPNCSVSMTFHMRDRSLRCHWCGARVPAPDACPECNGFGLVGQGFGTERLTEALAVMLPQARIERMDSDTSGRRGMRLELVERLRGGEIDVMVGTQMITKGFDLPGVTLVGVVLADLGLNLPDFRSAERTFQLLTQVAGRAGRGERLGRVLIQTYAPHHYSIRAARDQDYERFIRRELRLRQELGWPPFSRMALVRIEGPNAAAVAAMAERAAMVLRGQVNKGVKGDSMRVLGPAPAPIERLRGRYRWQVVVRSTEAAAMRAALASMQAELGGRDARGGVFVGIDLDPVNML